MTTKTRAAAAAEKRAEAKLVEAKSQLIVIDRALRDISQFQSSKLNGITSAMRTELAELIGDSEVHARAAAEMWADASRTFSRDEFLPDED